MISNNGKDMYMSISTFLKKVKPQLCFFLKKPSLVKVCSIGDITYIIGHIIDKANII